MYYTCSYLVAPEVFPFSLTLPDFRLRLLMKLGPTSRFDSPAQTARIRLEKNGERSRTRCGIRFFTRQGSKKGPKLSKITDIIDILSLGDIKKATII